MYSEVGRTILYVLGYLTVVVSIIPLVRNDNWIFRIFEYPRAQKLFLNFVLLVSFLFVANWRDGHQYIFAGLLAANGIYLFYLVFPYTIFGRVQLKGRAEADAGSRFSLLIFNVYQENRERSQCLACITANDPDIIVLVETDRLWHEALRPLKKRYPYCVLKPLENTYGMLLYSRFELVDPKVKFIVEPDVPSIDTCVKLSSGQLFQLYCLHPKPPVPNENPRSTERDAEVLTIGREAKAAELPVVVAGDLNDVAWSYTTELFLKVSGLLDPRRGRGFYNTFNAKYWFFRWPLDHLFCSKHFQLVSLKRLPATGSDHFPILVELAFARHDKKANENRQLEADPDEQAEAQQKIEKASA